MLKSATSKVMRLGRATMFMVGLAVILALVFGAASTALSATGGNFILGNANSAGAVSKLTTNIANPALQLVNNSTGAAATALNLTVASGKPPLTVNAAAGKATNLNADKLDGTSSSGLVPKKTYTTVVSADLEGNITQRITASCDAGDLLLSGGHVNISPSDHIFTEGPVESSNAQSWEFEIRTGPVNALFDQGAEALCADFGEAHTP
jgi:hypothetical protein